MKYFYVVLILLLTNEGTGQEIPYRTASWDADSLGNHRVVLRVESRLARDAVWAHIPWRRRDLHPDQKKIIVVDGTTSRELKNVLPINMSREEADIVFQPQTVPGDYYLYYLPSVGSKHSNYPKITYPKPEQTAERDWLWNNYLAGEDLKLRSWTILPRVQVVAFESIDSLNSFWPMSVIATRAETDSLASANPQATFLVFPEDRAHPITMQEDLPYRWIRSGAGTSFRGTVDRGEFYVFQIGLFAMRRKIDDIRLEFGDLKSENGKGTIAAGSFTCFNLGGVDCTHADFMKTVSVDSGRVQALWCGIQIPDTANSGVYSGELVVAPQGQERTRIPFQVLVSENLIPAKGDNDAWRLSRLRWLDSRLAVDDSVVVPFTPVRVTGGVVGILGRTLTLGPSGFPNAIESMFTEEMTSIGTRAVHVLAAPVHLIVEDSSGTAIQFQASGVRIIKQSPGALTWEASNAAAGVTMHVLATLEFDGTIEYRITLQADHPTLINNARLQIPINPQVAKFMMGLGFRGGLRPKAVLWNWDAAKNQDGAWIGDVNAGLQFTLKDENYSRPLNTNFYQLKPLVMPHSWWNGGTGGIRISENGSDAVLIEGYSGPRRLEPGQMVCHDLRLVITPFRPIDTRSQWQTRYYHKYDDIDTIARTGANTINVHHATAINPFLNYPFLRPVEMKAYADSAHARGMKMKIYYTVRELSNHAPELFALRSLGNEIFARGPGGGSSWLQEHLGSDYIAAWFVPELKDAAIINSGVSRWHNFYVEGVAWLLRNVGIDGLYIDDVAFDRLTMKRIRKVLDRARPGSLIDLHSANQYNPRDGFANSANLYLEHFPFIDRLWFGEYFDYDLSPDFWMVEVTGIPFGLMGEMLEKGGNPWRGMLYGMTCRLPWAGDPRPLWKLWDAFGIQDSRMIGYWVSSNPVKTASDSVLATVFLKKGTALVALASWSMEQQSVRLRVDWKAMGLSAKTVRVVAPAVENFQPAAEFGVDQEIPVEPGRGWLLIIQ